MTRERWGDAELHRVRGELCASLSQDAEAEAAFTAALAVAREQGSKWWELRTATSLAKLWQNQDKRAEACKLLSPIFGGFTEGFETADLMAARELLDELSSEAPQHATATASSRSDSAAAASG